MKLKTKKNENIEKIKSLGLAIQSQRKTLGISQGELSRLAGVSLNFVSQVEGGKSTVRISKLLDILYVLGIQFRLEFGKDRLVVGSLKGL